MDFLDPKKQKAHAIRLIVGYALIAFALIIATTILLYQAYGFGLDKNGKIIQSGLVFVSSQPSSANMFINGKLNSNQTNARLSLPAGQYTVDLQRQGYHDWKRAITVNGGSVEHFDYPFLVPNKLVTTAVKSYATTSGFSTQSLDRRWLLTQNSTSPLKFDEYDLNSKDPKSTLKEIDLPDSVLTNPQASDTWSLEQWSADNRHAVLKHTFQKDGQSASEFILLDRQDPTQSVNLTEAWGTNPTSVELRNRAYDQYYLYDQTTGTLQTASIKQPSPQNYLTHVSSFKSYGTNMVLYTTTQDMPAGKVGLKLRQGDQTYTIRTIDGGSDFTVDLTQYNGDWYMVVGVGSDGRAYIYKNPVDELNDQHIAVPIAALRVPNVNYVAFSANTRFIVAESGSNFAVYDAENDKNYSYKIPTPLDSPQDHAFWMDGSHLMMVSNGKAMFFDFDGANQQTLVANTPSALPAFDRDYKYLYTFAPQAAKSGDTAGTQLNSTAMRIPADL